MYTPVSSPNTLWCIGCSAQSYRNLSEDEISGIRDVYYGCIARGILAAGAVFLLLAVWVLYTAITTHLSVVAMVVNVGMCGLTIVCATACRIALRRGFEVRHDMNCRVAVRFEGIIKPENDKGGIKSLTNALRSRVVVPNGACKQWFEALPKSGLIWTVNGAKPSFNIHVKCVEVAPVPDYAATAAEWVEPLNYNSPDSVRLNQREMSKDERIELRRRVTNLLSRPIFTAVLLNGYAIGIVLLAFVNGRLPVERDRLLVIVILALTLAEDATLMVRLKSSMQLAKDLQIGRIMIARTPKEGVSNDLTPALSPPTEFLPVSRICWSENGVPAIWRVLTDR